MILICCEDREAYGYGHRSRMIALIDIFEALKIDFICAITNLQFEAELKKRRIKTTILSQTSGDENEAKELINKVEGYLDQIKLFICDGNRFGNSFLRSIKKFFKKNILIDDLGLPVRDQADIVWNPNIYAEDSLYSNWENIQIFAGRQYLLLRKEFERPLRPIKEDSIFVSLGVAGSDKIISIIDEMAKKYELSVIQSDSFSVNQMIDAIDNSLLTICGASVTLHEVWKRNSIALPIYQVEDQSLFKQFLIENKIDFINTIDDNQTQIKNNCIKLFGKYFNQESFTNNHQVRMAILKNNSKKLINEFYS